MTRTLYLSSFEPQGAYAPREVTFTKAVHCGERDDYVWVRIEPPLKANELATNTDIEVALLAPRHEGGSLLAPNSWPVHVYVCRTRRTPIGSASVPPDDVQILNWGILHEERRT